jgi:hypothetical protein
LAPSRAFLFRVLRATQHGAHRANRLLTELVLALHDPSVERLAADLHYGASPRYTDIRGHGFYPFEVRAVRDHFPPPPARILVPGAGGGREMIALLKLGYRVVGFDPVERYVQSTRAAIGAWSDAECSCATIQSWAQRPSGRYDAILCGWGVWAHVVARADRLAGLRAFRATCPIGPVLLSFFRGDDVFEAQERASLEPLHPTPENRIARAIRRGLRERVLRLPPLERGTGFHADFFFHQTTELELAEEAALAGYRVEYFERDASRYPNAVLRPAASS